MQTRSRGRSSATRRSSSWRGQTARAVRTTFSKLSGPATAAHIHLGAKGKAGDVLVPLCGPCKSGVSDSAKLTAALKKDFTKHALYVNVHTAKSAAGEIRGQIGG